MRSENQPASVVLVMLLPILISSCGRLTGDPGFADIELNQGRLELRSRPPFGFGSHEVFFHYYGAEGSRVLGRTTLKNDGANLGPHTVAVSHPSQTVWEIVLRGQEQADECWRLETNGDKIMLDRIGP